MIHHLRQNVFQHKRLGKPIENLWAQLDLGLTIVNILFGLGVG